MNIESDFPSLNPSKTHIKNGIAEVARFQMVDELSKFFANTYLLYLKTQNFHWNVTGSQFRSLHLLFEDQYRELAGAIDSIAERIRALGAKAPGSISELVQLASLQEKVTPSNSDEMILQLTEDHESVAACARRVYGIAERCRDEASADLLNKRIQVHERNAWMLRSSLNDA